MEGLGHSAFGCIRTGDGLNGLDAHDALTLLQERLRDQADASVPGAEAFKQRHSCRS